MMFPIPPYEYSDLRSSIREFFGMIDKFEVKRTFVIVEFCRACDYDRALQLSGSFYLEGKPVSVLKYRGVMDNPTPVVERRLEESTVIPVTYSLVRIDVPGRRSLEIPTYFVRPSNFTRTIAPYPPRTRP